MEPVYLLCEICQVDDSELVFRVEGNAIVRCRRCHLVYASPRPARSEEIYGQEYFDNFYSDLRGERAQLQNSLSWDRERVRLLTKGLHPGKLLDVGCGSGRFLLQAKQAGWEGTGIEYSPQAAALARRFGPVEVYIGAVEESPFSPNSFDAVSLVHVLEHVPHPRQTLHRIHELLRPQGRLLIEVPDFGCRRARKLKEHWAYIRPREHLYYFTRTTLAKLLGLEGFRIVLVRRAAGLGFMAAAENVAAPAAWAQPLYQLRRWLGPTPALRNFLRYIFWDVLRQHEHLLVVAEKAP